MNREGAWASATRLTATGFFAGIGFYIALQVGEWLHRLLERVVFK